MDITVHLEWQQFDLGAFSVSAFVKYFVLHIDNTRNQTVIYPNPM